MHSVSLHTIGLIGFLVLVCSLAGCTTIQYRNVFLDPSRESSGKLSRAELSEALSAVDAVAVENHLRRIARINTNDLAYYRGEWAKAWGEPKPQIDVSARLDPNTGGLVVRASDSRSFAHTHGVEHVSRQVYGALINHFGASRVARRTDTFPTLEWFH
jgi:hypothetical protein